MTFLRLLGERRALTAAAAAALLLAASACSTASYKFVKQTADHCENGTPDPDLGETDLDCGGRDCPGCTNGQQCSSSSDCADGQCSMGLCQMSGCDNQALDGDETGIDCGGSCRGCRDGQPCLAPTDCESHVCGAGGLCQSSTCTDGVRNGDELGIDCGGSFCDGCGIGQPCLVRTDCQSVSCDPTTQTCALNCRRGTGECDGNLDQPCETNLLTSAMNCGACGQVCELAHADASCTGGACQIDDCVKPWIRCNTDDSDGCEVNASTDAMNCGGCGMECPALHGTPSCVSSACVIECDDGFGDCDGDALTGCEVSVNDVDNCGACGKSCSKSQGEPNCVHGECGFTPCDTGQGDCDGDGVCETGLSDDPNNCGRCGHICSAPNGKADCVDGACVIADCDDGWADCDPSAKDGGFANGCETNIASDVKSCGGCGVRCDVVANGTGTCQAGSCALVCNNGFEDCDGRVNTGCETDTTSDPDHCGGCDHPCDIPGAKSACAGSTCAIDTCLANRADCTSADGCETDTSSSVQHCGSCQGTCSNAGATAVSCTGGKCDAPTCDPAHRSCDGKNENGCEADVTTPAACGACANACGTATPNCVLSGVSYGCQAKITIANAVPYPTAQALGSTLSFNATPHAGTNRLVLVAIAAESQGNGLAGARPDSVTFGGTSMTAGPSQVGANDTWSPDEFIYYLALGDSTTDGAAVTVTIDGSTAPAETAILVQEFQLNGVRQNMPITASAGAFLGTTTPEAPDPSVIGLALPVSTSGSLIYSLVSAESMDGGTCTTGTPSSNCPAWSVSPSANLTVTETMATTPLTIAGTTPIRAFGMVVTAASAGLPTAGTYTPSWTIPATGRMTHLAVAIAPAP